MFTIIVYSQANNSIVLSYGAANKILTKTKENIDLKKIKVIAESVENDFLDTTG